MGFLGNEAVLNSSYIIYRSNKGNMDGLRRDPIIHPSTINLKAIRCPNCNHLLGFIDGRAQIKCYKCKFVYLSGDNRVAPTTNALI
jgi:phage FluMu protein Com